jgi:hypothetical protein
MENNTLLFVLDVDETLLHYAENPLPYDPDFEPVFNDNDQLYLRPGLRDFLDYVKSTNGKVQLGIWTFGNKPYAYALLPILNFCLRGSKKKEGDICSTDIEFLYTVENMTSEMKPKELSFVMENYLGKPYNSEEGLPKNMFLIDNRPENVSHDININNAILVESYTGKNNDDTMFKNLIRFSKKFLESGGQVPKKFVQSFIVNGEKKKIISIGKHFDDGWKPNMTIKSHKHRSSSSGMSSSAGSKNIGSKSTGSKSTGSKSTGNKSIGSKIIGSKIIGSKSVGSKSVGSKSVGSKSVGSKSVGSKIMGGKSSKKTRKIRRQKS